MVVIILQGLDKGQQKATSGPRAAVLMTTVLGVNGPLPGSAGAFPYTLWQDRFKRTIDFV